MAVDIFNIDGIADPAGVVKHGAITVNPGTQIGSRILTNDDAVKNLPVIDDIQEKYDTSFKEFIRLNGAEYLTANDIWTTTKRSYGIKFKADGVAGIQTLFGLSTESLGRTHIMLEDATLIHGVTNDSSSSIERQTNSLGTVVAGQWHIAIASFQPNDTHWISLDGELLVDSDPDDSFAPGATVTDTFVGAKNASVDEPFAGEIAWVAGWDQDGNDGMSDTEVSKFSNIGFDPRNTTIVPIFYQSFAGNSINNPANQVGYDLTLV